MKNHAGNVHQRLVPDPFLFLLNNPKKPFIKNKRALELVTSRSSGFIVFDELSFDEK